MGVVEKKSKEKKIAELDRLEMYSKTYPIFAIVKNPQLSNATLKNIREENRDGKIFFFRKKLARNFYKLPEIPKGEFFLYFGTNETLEKFKAQTYYDFLEVGDVAPRDVVMEKQVIKKKELQSLLPVVDKGSLKELIEDYLVCKEGDAVDEKQVKILKFMDQKLKERTLEIFSINSTEDIQKIKKE